MIFIDASFIIALVNNNDIRHEKAVRLANKINDEEKIVSNIIIIKVFNILRKFNNGKLNKEVFRIIKDNFQVYNEDLDLYDDALNIQLKNKGKLEFTHCVKIAIMEKMNITKIVSFDKQFDRIDGISRIS